MIAGDASQHGETHAAIRKIQEAELNDEQRRIYNDCKAGPRGSVPPPVHVWLNSPGLAEHAHQLGAHVRFGTAFTPKQTEITILLTARYWTAQFEWAAHVGLALKAGMSAERSTRSPSARAAFHRSRRPDRLRFRHSYYQTHRVDQRTFDRIVSAGASRASSIWPG